MSHYSLTSYAVKCKSKGKKNIMILAVTTDDGHTKPDTPPQAPVSSTLPKDNFITVSQCGNVFWLSTPTLIGPEVQLHRSCTTRMSCQTNNKALIGWYYTLFTNHPPIPALLRKRDTDKVPTLWTVDILHPHTSIRADNVYTESARIDVWGCFPTTLKLMSHIDAELRVNMLGLNSWTLNLLHMYVG